MASHLCLQTSAVIIINEMRLIKIYPGFEMCFAPKHLKVLGCLGAKHISNQDFWHRFEKGERCYHF